MCREVFEIVKKMDLSNVEVRLALQCAPVITGIKMSNLLMVSNGHEEKVEEILKGTQIQPYCLFHQGRNAIYFLYRIEEFETYLEDLNVIQTLKQFGYMDLSIKGIMKEFQNRYIAYKEQSVGFPHEIGILLGYPIEDVKGFIQHKGEDYLYAGYWKVYKDVEEKKLLFDAYESAKEGLLLLVGNGYEIHSIINYFDTHRY